MRLRIAIYAYVTLMAVSVLLSLLFVIICVKDFAMVGWFNAIISSAWFVMASIGFVKGLNLIWLLNKAEGH